MVHYLLHHEHYHHKHLHFKCLPSSPIKVPIKNEQNYSLQNNTESVSWKVHQLMEIICQPDRSDTPHSMHSTTSNESSDSGYCGYVESFPCKIY